MKLRTLSVAEKAAIIKGLNLSTTTASKIFGITEQEIKTTMKTIDAGLFKPAEIPVNELKTYKKLIDSIDITTIETPVHEKKKRGRKTNKIYNAYANIPSAPCDLDEFVKKYSVSVAVMRQHKRFDPFPEKGKIVLKKDKKTNKIYIWRQTNES